MLLSRGQTGKRVGEWAWQFMSKMRILIAHLWWGGESGTFS